MTLESGRKLGPYEIIAPAGVGGMGEVYKARDTRLDRTVAIKVLPQRTALNTDLRARFEREAKAISSLNHPNICTLYDVGHEDDMDYLVMEYIEGESVSERLKRGPIALEEALQIGLQVAEALTSAHGKGLVHRDLKPANVMLTRDGAKLLDFGLAKLQISGGVIEGVSGVTQTTPLTGTGTIIGTIQYMSPEQLEGSEADHRSDIFAFGAVLYEMIAGQRPFEGKSHASIIAAIIERDPTPLSSVMPMSPPGLDRLVKKCLQKDPNARWQSARDMADEIRWLSQGGSQVGVPVPVSKRRRVRFRLAWGLAIVGFLAAAGLSIAWLTRPQPQPRFRRFAIQPPPNLVQSAWPRISPDGTMLAFLGTDSSEVRMIWVRPMNSLKANPLPGTESAGRPFWSPESKWLAYFEGNGQLKKVPVSGGPVQLLGEVPRGADGAWGQDNQILFDGARSDSIRAFSATGGVARSITRIDREAGEVFHAWPETLPDNEHFLYLITGDSGAAGSDFQLVVGSYGSDVKKVLRKVSSKVEYSPEGYLLFVLNTTLVAQPFDLGSLTLHGEPIPIAENIPVNRGTGGADFSISDEGTLVYQSTSVADRTLLILKNRDGSDVDTLGPPAKYQDFSFSPDDRYVAYAVDDGTGSVDIWIRDRRRQVVSRLTFDPATEDNPVWSRDGKDVYYSVGSIPIVSARVKSASGLGASAPAVDVMPGDTANYLVFDVAGDNREMSLGRITGSEVDILTARRGDSLSAAREILSSPFNEFCGTFSPDGNFLAYVSDESDRPEVYLARIKGDPARWQVSFGGGFQPLWNRNGRELFYVFGNNVISVPVSLGATVELGQPDTLFTAPITSRQFALEVYDVTSDGQQFLVNEQLRFDQKSQFVVVQDWSSELNENR